MRETIASLMAGELDDQLVYRKRLRRPLEEYQRNVPPHVRAARLADEENREPRAPAAVSERRLDQLRHGHRRAGAAGSAQLAARLRSLPDAPASAGRRRNFALHRRRFCYTSDRATWAILTRDEMAAIQYHSALSDSRTHFSMTVFFDGGRTIACN